MKFRKFLPLLMALPLASCSFDFFGLFKKKELVIPTVDVDSIKVNLPSLPSRNTGAIRSADGYDYIDLYELSDFHGAVNTEQHTSGTYIGLPKLADFFDKKRSENPGGTLILSSGDMFQGSADSNLTRGYMVNYSMQYMGFDAMAIGNHEFDWTDEWMKKNAELKYNTSSIPFLGANITKNGEIPSFLKKSTVVSRGEYKIGVIGVIGNELETSILKSCVAEYDFSKYKEIVEAESARLRSEDGCNAVVLLAHEGADKIEQLNNGAVDAIFGGHAHENKMSSNGSVPSLATKNYGQSVAQISLKFNSADKSFVAAENSQIIEMKDVASSLKENADVKAIMNEYASAIDEIKNIKLGRCNADLKYDKSLKNICTKSMHEAAIRSIEANGNSGIDTSKVIAAYHNVNGGIRDDILKGKITYGNVYRSFPFDNEVVLYKVSGKDFVAKCGTLSSLGIYKTIESKSDIKSDEDYYIVTTDYLALGKEFSAFKSDEGGITDEDLIRTGCVVRDEVAQKIYSIGRVKDAEWSKPSSEFRILS